MPQCKDIEAGQVQFACEESERRYHAGKKGERTIDVLMEVADVPRKVAFAKLQKMNKSGRVEYGTALESCWWLG